MITLTKVLVTMTCVIVIALGSFISSEKQNILKSESIDTPNLSKSNKFEEKTVSNEDKLVNLFNQEDNSDDSWDDVTDSDESVEDSFFHHSIEKNAHIKNSTKKSSLLLVSTLDGSLSALDSTESGKLLWQIETEPGSLLSSSISKVELNSHGKLVRLIPSLDGGLYKFDGDGIEPIPVSADSLLHSSYHAADDLLITGGREVRTYGVDAHTGHLQYVCGTSGCHVESPEAGSSGEFLVIRRHSQIIRAIEPRTGTERWNFSVGRHEASLLRTDASSFEECKSNNLRNPEKQMDCFVSAPTNENLKSEPSTTMSNSLSLNYKVIVPDGIICAIHPQKVGQVLWKYKFESPVVHIWQLEDGKLTPLDIFHSDYIPALENKLDAHGGEVTETISSPLLYVGIHKHQLYVQKNHRVNTGTLPGSIQQEKDLLSIGDSQRYPRIQWQPLTASSLIAYQGRPGRFTTSTSASVENNENQSGKHLNVEHENDPKVTALIVRHQIDYPHDRGFYLFDEKNRQHGNKKSISQDEENVIYEEELWEGGKNTPVHIVIVSLWFWWREVVVISLLTALIFNMIITRQVVDVLQQRWAIELHRHISSIVPPLIRSKNAENTVAISHPALLNSSTDTGIEIFPDPKAEPLVVKTPANSSTSLDSPAYVSRYLTDFEPIQCLGRGGFGLVFEVRNRLDDCHYAVKRIQLPNNEEAREKVMREVKALAKLDNPHIVRYFHAWIECPPPGWQESQDAAWIDTEALTAPTSFNTGEESFVSRKEVSHSTDFMLTDEEWMVNRFQFPNQIDTISSFAYRRKSFTNDSSFDIVFEHNSRRSCTSSNSNEFEDEYSVSNDNEIKHDESLTNDNTTQSDDAKPSQRNLQIDRNPNKVSDAKMYLFIQMQLCRKESLREWLRAHLSHRDPFQVLNMFNEIVRAVEYVHLQGLIHRDLKPSNIFFAPDGAIKIGDFGLVTAMAEEAYFHSPVSSDGIFGSSVFQRTHTDQVGTQLYMSPEQVQGKPYNHKVDIYSLGLILVELLWPLSTQMEQVTVISQLRKLRFPTGFTEKYPNETTLLHKMLSRNPDERPTTYGIRASSCLKNFQDPTLEIPEYLHFTLQRPRSMTRTSSTSSS